MEGQGRAHPDVSTWKLMAMGGVGAATGSTNSTSHIPGSDVGHVMRSWPMKHEQEKYIPFLDMAPKTSLTTSSLLMLFLCQVGRRWRIQWGNTKTLEATR